MFQLSFCLVMSFNSTEGNISFRYAILQFQFFN